jgi:type IV pilus assembly protein PilO
MGILLLGIFTFGAYYLYVVPAKTKVEQKQSEYKMSTQELNIINNKLKQTSEQTVLSTMEIQKRVPVKRLLDQFFLDIEKSEIISGTNIMEMKLKGSEKDEEINLTTNPTGNTASTTNTQQNTAPQGQQNSSTPKEESLPNGIKKTTVVLSGEANTYFEMEKFLTELESLKRIVKVEQFKFTGREEVYSVDQSTKPIEFEVTISAYYFPTLEDLQKELPPLDTPKISNKKNPTSEFSDLVGNDSQQP